MARFPSSRLLRRCRSAIFRPRDSGLSSSRLRLFGLDFGPGQKASPPPRARSFLLSMPMRRPGHAPRGFASRSHHRDMRRGRDFRPEAGSPAKIGVGLIRPAQRDRFFDGDPAPVANPARPPRERRPVPARTPSAMLRQHFAPEGCRHDTGAAQRGDKSGTSDPPLARQPASSPWRRSPGSGRRRPRVRRSPRRN